MFWRLFLTYLALVVTAVGLVGAIVLRRTEGEAIFFGLAREVLTAAVAIVAISTVPAYLLARQFTRPLIELARGANRLADGDLGHKIHAVEGREFTALARTFNDMGSRLSLTFDQLARDREQLITILSGMVEGVVAFDNEERVLFANDRAAALLEFDATAIGRKLWEVTRQRAVQEIAEKALQGAGPYREELDWKGPGGEEPRRVRVASAGAEFAGRGDGAARHHGATAARTAAPGLRRERVPRIEDAAGRDSIEHRGAAGRRGRRPRCARAVPRTGEARGRPAR